MWTADWIELWGKKGKKQRMKSAPDTVVTITIFYWKKFINRNVAEIEEEIEGDGDKDEREEEQEQEEEETQYHRMVLNFIRRFEKYKLFSIIVSSFLIVPYLQFHIQTHQLCIGQWIVHVRQV